MIELIDRLINDNYLEKEDLVKLISFHDEKTKNYLFEKSVQIRQLHYGKDVFIRGLIEISNYCGNDCLYCGIRRSNYKTERYRLSKDEIVDCCGKGYSLGFRTFVLQGGEDPYYTDEIMVDIIVSIKSLFPDCAVTLSLGEKSAGSYLKFFEAGADRYLLRHETANNQHYSMLHPNGMSLDTRKQCLKDLKIIGYQTGSGFMVGSPFQTPENLAEDLLFLYELRPEMVGIGPFIPHHDTPFAKMRGGDSELTLFLLGLIRLMLPRVLLPATTALGTVDSVGREKAVLAGANVIMPNLSPANVRDKYMIYDNKLSTGAEASESLSLLKKQMEKIGYKIVVDRGDYRRD